MRGSATATRRVSRVEPGDSWMRRVGDALRVVHGILVARHRRLLVEAVLLGVVGALSARVLAFAVRACEWIFLGALAGYRPPGLPGEGGTLVEVVGPHGLWLVPLVTTLGGLLSGGLVFALAPEAEGHGTDAAVKAYHFLGGRIRARVPPIKLLASALTIGSGGAAGREGPTALMAAGVGSVYANAMGRSESERRTLVLAGMAAGLSAMFRSPIGAAVFAVEVLYADVELEASAILYTLIGSVVAYAVNGTLVGWKPFFQVPEVTPRALDHVWFAALGLASGVIATLLVAVFYAARRAFAALPIPRVLKPAAGGLGVGLLALALPQVLGGGYGWVQLAIDGKLALGLLLALLVAKALAFSLTIGSGGSGGVFAPSLFVGAMLGGAVATIFHRPPAPFVVVGMASVFAGAAHVPLATMLMVTEMTGGYHLLAPAALAVTMSYLVESALAEPLEHASLYAAQVPHRADSPAHGNEQLRWALRYMARGNTAEAASSGPRLELGVLPATSPVLGSTLAEALAGRAALRIVGVFRGGVYLSAQDALVLEAGDEVLVACDPEAYARLVEQGVVSRL